MAEEKIFANGFSFKRNEKAPEFVIGNISIKIGDAIDFMNQHEKNGWLNLSVKQARTGNYYIELDTFEPKGGTKGAQGSTKTPAPVSKPTKVEEDEELPF